MKLSKRLALSAAVAASLLTLAGASHAQTALDNIQKAKLIKIAIPTDFPPYGLWASTSSPRAWTSTWPTTLRPKWG
jgi:polar amino acid transport system substrate-binding protein